MLTTWFSCLPLTLALLGFQMSFGEYNVRIRLIKQKTDTKYIFFKTSIMDLGST